jgi:hypothetical protein
MVTKLIAMRYFCTVQLLGLEPSVIVVPFTKEKQACLQHTDTMWQMHWLTLQDSLENFLILLINMFPYFLTKCERIQYLRILTFYWCFRLWKYYLLFLSGTKYFIKQLGKCIIFMDWMTPNFPHVNKCSQIYFYLRPFKPIPQVWGQWKG